MATHDVEEAVVAGASLAIEAGRGRQCLTIAPYKPYSAMILHDDDRLSHVCSVFRHLARRFWNQT